MAWSPSVRRFVRFEALVPERHVHGYAVGDLFTPQPLLLKKGDKIAELVREKGEDEHVGNVLATDFGKELSEGGAADLKHFLVGHFGLLEVEVEGWKDEAHVGLLVRNAVTVEGKDAQESVLMDKQSPLTRHGVHKAHVALGGCFAFLRRTFSEAELVKPLALVRGVGLGKGSVKHWSLR